MTRRDWLSLAALAGAGCHKEGGTVIGVAPKGTSSIFWQSVQAGSLAAAKKYGVEILWNGPPQETEYARQIQIVDSMINRQVAGIVLSPTDGAALVAPVERAMAQGIPVTIFDSGIDTENYVSFVATDNRAAGGLAAKTMSGLLPSGGEVALVRHAPGSLSTSRREEGFHAAVESTYPDLKIVNEQFCMSDRARALAVAEDMLTAHPALSGLFCSSEAATVGAAQALRARGLAGKVKLVGFDASPELQEGLRDGVIDALVVQDPFFMGFRGVETIIEKLRGETPQKRIDSPARAVTKADLDSPEVQKLLAPDLEQYL
ncbi:MAG: substrate-binding domain-containing protein [Bryobacterales bacterium]|nr:substrate-binding domain-containing protein [Acidobacteriota bacterium]MCB9383511.1 substrate-binding domain-containing protein [Bryobacterales bacterium]